MKIGIIIHFRPGIRFPLHISFVSNFLMQGIPFQSKESQHQTIRNKCGLIALTCVPKSINLICCLGAPVRGYMLSPVMQAYLRQLQSLKGKVVLGSSHNFPKPTMVAIRPSSVFCDLPFQRSRGNKNRNH